MTRKRKPRATKTSGTSTESRLDSDAATKRLERARLYRNRPEVRERQRILMANRRAEIKARRRQWDKPQQPRDATPLPEDSSTDAEADNLDSDHDSPALTPAEMIALEALTDLAVTVQLRKIPAKTIDNSTLREETPSISSSTAAVEDLRISRPKYPQDVHPWIMNRQRPLPGYVATETALQKKMRRELGIVGPLTPTQVAQIKAYRLRNRSRGHVDVEAVLDATTAPALSVRRWESIRTWLTDLGDFEDWDFEERAIFVAETERLQFLKGLTQLYP
ncbi:hypothetical protein R3P38DRAFT_2936560 [Favolaschia claudopus]|uniref:Uncharacterized protein n=1 Tax=Favolaschia claudopus TaxID=2862362 RepID=A0AAW0BQC7_9AGAR